MTILSPSRIFQKFSYIFTRKLKDDDSPESPVPDDQKSYQYTKKPEINNDWDKYQTYSNSKNRYRHSN